MSYVKLGGMIDEAPPLTNIELTYTGKLLTNFNGTPNMGFDYFEATWSKPGMADWTVHGSGVARHRAFLSRSSLSLIRLRAQLVRSTSPC